MPGTRKVNGIAFVFRLSRLEGYMSNTKQREPEGNNGGPLAVCINDCQLDYGQASSELVHICFQVRCAFAEMRWGCSAAAIFEAVSSVVDESPTGPIQNAGL